MKLFLQMVGAMVVGLIIVIFALYLYIRWKFRSVFRDFAEALKNIGGAPIPPFRVKLKKKSEVFDDDEDDDLENKEDFLARCQEFAAIGFERIEDYYVEEIPLSMTAFVDRSTSTYGLVYDHPIAGVWCDVGRRYEDGSDWTFGTNRDPLVDYPVNKTMKFFPEQPLSAVVEKFKAEAPSDGAILVSNDEFPRFFERVYAEEMDWRIERGGATEAEIRRIADRDEVECTPQHIQTIQMQWRIAIANFQKERILRRYRKDHELSRSAWDELEDEGVVVYQQMQAEEILQAFDDYYFPDMGFDFGAIDEEHDDPEYGAMRRKWDEKLGEIREQLKTDPPQTIFRRLVENSDRKEFEWEFKASVEKPLPADIWLRHWNDEDDDLYDDPYDGDEDDDGDE